jgi:hypothetical protein
MIHAGALFFEQLPQYSVLVVMMKSFFQRIPAEAIIWIGGLLTLFFIEPDSGSHFTICPLYQLGFDFCPGCGLGQSINFLFSGDFNRSFESHPLGLLALTIISFRIFTLIKHNFKAYGQNY